MAEYRVQVVDDNREVRRMVVASIKSLAAEIDVLDVPSAEEALVIGATLPLDLLVLDIRLPGMSGLEMVTRLHKRKPETKIILVTGAEDESTRQQATRAGAEACFFKPIDIGAFLDAVRRCLWSDQSGSDSPSALAVEVSPRAAAGLVSGPGKSKVPGAAGLQTVRREPAIPHADALTGDVCSLPAAFRASLTERLTALKGQVQALSVILVHSSGQVLESIGETTWVPAEPQLLPALVETFKVASKVSQVLGEASIESLFYFMSEHRRIYLAAVNSTYALLVMIKGIFEPDKLVFFDRTVHLAVQDIRAIFENTSESDQDDINHALTSPAELPAEILVDPETLARVDDMFSLTSTGSKEDEADGFWDALGESGALDGKAGKGSLSYDQAQELGLTPEENPKP